jgi:hypothetical protein
MAMIVPAKDAKFRLQKLNYFMISVRQLQLVRQITQMSIVVGSLYWSAVVQDAGLANIKTKVSSQPQVPSATKVSTNTLIVPGKSVGPITAKTTYPDLVKLFGVKRLTPTRFYGTEGQVQFPATEIALGRNRVLTVVWKDMKQVKPLQVVINDPTWKTAEGIGIGSSLTKLRQVLGKFKITGLGWDYGNEVIDLSPAIQIRYAGLKIVVEADYLAGRRFPNDLQAVTGDKVILAASDRHWQPLKIRVSGLSVYFPEASSPKQSK